VIATLCRVSKKEVGERALGNLISLKRKSATYGGRDKKRRQACTKPNLD